MGEYKGFKDMPKKSNNSLRVKSGTKAKRTYTKKQVKQVDILVNPSININGIRYLGNVSVPEDIAVDLRRMMYEYEQTKSRVSTFIDHPTRELGSV